MGDRIYAQTERSFIHDSNHEQILMDRFNQMGGMSSAMRTGDVETVWRYFSQMSESVHEVNRRYTPEEENQYQTFARLISTNAIFTMICFENGVHPLYLHSISRRFDKEIARCPVEGEPELTRKIVEDYCKLIRNASMEHYGEFSDRIIRILLSSLTDPPSLQELADKMYVSTATVTRRFKKETGQTIPEYLNRSRVRVAKFYLQEGRGNLGQIAQAVGFNDASYFTKVFQRHAGMTPTEYLQKLRSQAKI